MSSDSPVTEPPTDECHALRVPKDVWGLIGRHLSPKSLLNLRQTCSLLNRYVISNHAFLSNTLVFERYVIGMQARWYKAHQWFLANQHGSAKRKVKSAIRVHTCELGMRCFDLDTDYPGRPDNLKGGAWIRNQANANIISIGIAKALKNGDLKEENCKRSFHFQTKVPKREQDIPLDKFFKPKRNNYIYYYLIEQYRAKAPDHRSTLHTTKRNLSQYQSSIIQMEHNIKYARAQIEILSKKLESEEKKFKGNAVFEGYSINGYKTPAQVAKGATTTTEAPPKKKTATKKKVVTAAVPAKK